ncbi:MAG: hypothetical protein ACTHYN_15465 [Marinobacter sp.]|uniref:hypothetical protein n=1 Tax=Marinobacter sp. TaxID=50741 RepID=UPI003F9C8D81
MLKKNTWVHALIIAGMATGLTACGGSDDGSSGIPSPDSYTAGTFKDAAIDGVAYPNHLPSYGLGYASGENGAECYGQTHYFETEDGRVRVYGSTAFSETDFRVVSTMIHSRLDLIMGKFGMSWNEFVDQRPVFNRNHLEMIVNEYNGSTGHVDASVAVQNWSVWDGATLEEKLAFAKNYYIQHTTHSDLELPLMNDILLPRDALVVCLSPGMRGAQFGEGSQFGIQVPPEVSTYHSKVGEIFAHEIVHFVQSNIADVGQRNPFAVMPRWFTEGQAVYLAGQSRASVNHHHQINAADITNWHAEQISNEDTGLLYKHYGLAYQYVHENNGTAAILNMMQSMKTNTDAPQVWQRYKPFDNENPAANDKDPGLAFGRAFAEHIDDHTGADLEFERYRTDYHTLMNGWASQP